MLALLVFALLPLVLAIAFVGGGSHRATFHYDFRGDIYGAGRAVRAHRDPYRTAYLARQAALMRRGAHVDTVLATPVYPAPLLVVATPVTLIPYRAAAIFFGAASVAALLLALYLLGVADWRCYGVPFLSWPVLHGIMLGALTPLLVLGVAAAWRWRGRVGRTAGALAAVMIAKLFLWPLGIWLLATRRYRTAALTGVLAVAAVVGGWAIIGFGSLRDYPGLLVHLSYLEERAGVSPIAALLALGLGRNVAMLIAVALAASLTAAAVALRERALHEQRLFGLAVVASLVASPIVWPHYFALLLVPIALFAPRLSPIWFVPLLGDAAPVAQTTRHTWAIAPYCVLTAAVAWWVLRRGDSGGRRLAERQAASA